MSIRKYLDWRGYIEGFYLTWIKTVTTTLLALIGSNAAEQMGVKSIGLSWQQAVSVLVSITVLEILKYLQSKPKPEVISVEEETTEWKHEPTKKDSGYSVLEFLFLLAFIASIIGFIVFATGCSTVKGDTERTYIDPKLNVPIKEVTNFKARSFFDGKNAFNGLKNSITDKTSGTSIGNLNQESSGSNAVQVLKIVVEGVGKAAIP